MNHDLKKVVEMVGGEPVLKFVKGDVVGHEFHGNQYTAALGDKPHSSERTHGGRTAHAVESKLKPGTYRAGVTTPPISGNKGEAHTLTFLGGTQHATPAAALEEAHTVARKTK